MEKNIIIVFSDQQRPDSLGIYGQKLPTSPRIDEWSKNGVVFDNAYSCQPICGPARACLQSGKFATRTGCFNNEVAFPLDEKTFSDYLNDVGYETAYIGKWHLANTESRFAQQSRRKGQQETYLCKDELVPPDRRGGWQYWRGINIMENASHGFGGHLGDNDMNIVPLKEDRYRVDAVTDYAIEFLENRNKDKPFCMMVSYLEPHWQNDRQEHEIPIGEEIPFLEYDIPPSLAHFNGKANWLKYGFFKEYPKYLAQVHIIDRNFGRILDSLDNLGLSEDTVIIYSSDHGCHFGYRNGGAKDSCHDDSIHIPMILGGADFKSGHSDTLVSLIDIPATVLDIADIPVPSDFDGISLLTQTSGKIKRNAVFYQISPWICARGIRTDKWKYSVNAPFVNGDLQSEAPVYEEAFLYDLKNDAEEEHNLVEDESYTSVRAELQKMLIAEMVKAGEREPVIIPFTKSKLKKHRIIYKLLHKLNNCY